MLRRRARLAGGTVYPPGTAARGRPPLDAHGAGRAAGTPGSRRAGAPMEESYRVICHKFALNFMCLMV